MGRALSSPECAVEVLLLRSHYIMERGQHFMLATFCKHLAQNRTLRVLALQSSYVDDYAAERIALACPPQLEVLDLSFNLIGATNAGSGYRAIGAAIARTNVKECYLGNNRWEGLHSMFQILADCDRISRVFVREKLGDEIYTTKLVSRRTHPSSGDSGEDRRRDVIIAYSQYKSMPDLVVVTPSSEKHNEADEEKFEEEEIVAPLLPCNHEAEDEVKVDDEPLSYSTNNSTLQQPLL